MTCYQTWANHKDDPKTSRLVRTFTRKVNALKFHNHCADSAEFYAVTTYGKDGAIIADYLAAMPIAWAQGETFRRVPAKLSEGAR